MRHIQGLWQRIGRRGGSLLFLALVDFSYAGSLANPPAEAKQSPTVQFIGDLAPLWAWALLWFAVGVTCIVGAFLRHDRWAFVAAMFLKVLWAVTFTAGWAIAGLDRGWLSGAIFGGFAAFVFMISGWPEPGDPVVVETPAREAP